MAIKEPSFPSPGEATPILPLSSCSNIYNITEHRPDELA